jgi:Flp pilus assembly protein TadG
MRISRLLLRPFRVLPDDRSGSAVLEFAFVSAFLMALLLPMADLGMAFYVKSQVMTAAEAGVQFAFLNGWQGNNRTVQTNSPQTGAGICAAVIKASGLGNSNACSSTANTGSDALINTANPQTNDPKLSLAAPNFTLSCYCVDSTVTTFNPVTLTSPWTPNQCTSQPNCAGSNDPKPPGAYVTVRTRYVYKPLIPYSPLFYIWGRGAGNSITLQSQATVRIQ